MLFFLGVGIFTVLVAGHSVAPVSIGIYTGASSLLPRLCALLPQSVLGRSERLSYRWRAAVFGLSSRSDGLNIAALVDNWGSNGKGYSASTGPVCVQMSVKWGGLFTGTTAPLSSVEE